MNALTGMCGGSAPQPGGVNMGMLSCMLHSLGAVCWEGLMSVGSRVKLVSLLSCISPRLLSGHWKLLLQLVTVLADHKHASGTR